MKWISILFSILLLSGTYVRALTQTDNFVEIIDGRFSTNGKPYYYIGTSFWHVAILGSQGQGGNQEHLLKELNFMKANGITNLRVLVDADGVNGVVVETEPTLQTAPSMYNNTTLDGLDFFLSELGRRSIHAVLFLNNNWEWSGGYSQHLYRGSHGEVPMPKVAGWNVLSDCIAQYAKPEKAHKLSENHVRQVVSRVSRYTKLRCGDDPATMARQIGSEPRPFDEEDKGSSVKWIAEYAALIRSIDSNHLISVGLEGMANCKGGLSLQIKFHRDINIDYSAIHTWPDNWGWIDKTDIPGTLGKAIASTHEYIGVHVAEAQKMNKPLILEEFGLPKDNVVFNRKSLTVLRNRYYGEVSEMVKEHTIQKSVFRRCSFWAWGRFVQPRHLFWQKGGDYMRDPGQEEQGLDSACDTDATVKLVAGIMNEINRITQVK